MRLSPSIVLAGATLLFPTSALAKPKPRVDTVFNSITVPPFLELTPTNWDEEIKKSKYILVKHYR
jgi:protein disulfide-isomerase